MLKKKYGQNFLNSSEISIKISKILNFHNENLIEIGPGNLALTNYLVSHKMRKFIALEIDKSLFLKNENYKKKFKNLILNVDALKFNEVNFFKSEPFYIISNLPFNLSNKLLIKWVKLQYETKLIKGMILMFQKELAQRITSKVNSKKYGRLSIFAQSVFNIHEELLVKKNNFTPQPKVDAIVLKFIPVEKMHKINFTKLEKITNFFFNSRRKKNEKKIKNIFNQNQIKINSFDKLYNLRPENISKEIYYKMSNLI